ncbi:hypothetical protein GQ53DRAFT_122249 [Thozetella sp. PMI_491]|nr:hypothetical protein GQ53DRAFT_122249 [Thozetella sp. PMI_491]
MSSKGNAQPPTITAAAILLGRGFAASSLMGSACRAHRYLGYHLEWIDTERRRALPPAPRWNLTKPCAHVSSYSRDWVVPALDIA